MYSKRFVDFGQDGIINYEIYPHQKSTLPLVSVVCGENPTFFVHKRALGTPEEVGALSEALQRAVELLEKEQKRPAPAKVAENLPQKAARKQARAAKKRAQPARKAS